MTLYLSRLPLDPLSRQVQKEIASPYEMHRTLSHGYSGLAEAEYKAARVLFRVDDDKEGAPHVLVQSKIEPSWDALRNHLGAKRYFRGEPVHKSWTLCFTKDQRLRFRLLANPTFRPFIEREHRPQKNIDRKGLFLEHERLDWLLHRAQEHGFALESERVTLRRNPETGKKVHFRGRDYDELTLPLPLGVEVVSHNAGPSDRDRFRLPGEKSQFSAARFDGTLCVVDPIKFTAAVENGIGPAKGFGFGLLSLARV